MKRLSISLPALALALALFVSVRAESPASTAVTGNSHYMQKSYHWFSFFTFNPVKEAKWDYIYYWYRYPDDTLIDYKTLVAEENEWTWWLGGVYVDDDSMGGTLLAKGYMTNNHPHVAYPLEYLYAHYTD